MKKIVSLICAVLLSVTCFAFFGGNNDVKKADALNALYFLDGKADHSTVYYFCDAEPLLLNTLNVDDAQSIIVDQHDFLNEQELRYMLFTGYFWGLKFDPSLPEGAYCNLVVLEFRTFKPSEATMINLINCFKYQRAEVIFASPFYNDYFSLDCDVCPTYFDSYTAFLRNTIRIQDQHETTNLTTIYLSDDFLLESSVFEIENSFNSILRRSAALRRLLCYYNYGIDFDNSGIKYEKEFFSQMWRDFFTDYLNLTDSSYSDDGFYIENYDIFDNDLFVIENIDSFVALWNYVVDKRISGGCSLGNPISSESDFCTTYDSNLRAYYESVAGNDTEVDSDSSDDGSLDTLHKKGIYVYIDIQGDAIFDFCNFRLIPKAAISGLTSIESNYMTVGEEPNQSIASSKMYMIGTWQVSNDFANYMEVFYEDYVHNNSLHETFKYFEIYLYEKDPIIYDPDGVPIVSDSALIELLGSELDNFPNALSYFLDIFTAKLARMTWI